MRLSRRRFLLLSAVAAVSCTGGQLMHSERLVMPPMDSFISPTLQYAQRRPGKLKASG